MSESFFCRRQDLGLLLVSGTDARQFLHAQTTQAVDDFERSTTRPAAWLNAKGRVRALFDMVPLDGCFWLITESDNVTWLAEQLRFFVLRANVSLEVISSRSVYSCGSAVRAWLTGRGIVLDAGSAFADNDAIWVNSGSGCIEVFGEPETVEAILTDFAHGDVDLAIAAQIASGRPSVPGILRDRYIPQMLNLEKLGAISFRKGCYPGQEIVARTENLGEVKRRLRRFAIGHGDRPSASDVLTDAHSKVIGEINRVAAVDAGYETLAVVNLGSAGETLKLESDGRKLTPLPLPYDD